MKTYTAPALDKKILQELSKKTAMPWLRAATMDWVIMSLAIIVFYTTMNPLTFISAILIIGNRQHALAILGHDGTHFTLSLNKKFNDFLTNMFCFWPLGLTVSGYRSLHWKHHKHTGTIEDPELAHKRSRNPQWDLPAKPLAILKYALLDVIGCSIPDYKIIVTYSKPDSPKEYRPLILWHVIFASILIVTGFYWALILWYTSVLTTFMMWFRLRLWLEHQGTPGTHRLKLRFWQAALLAPHNSWMHWEHHNWPSVPYHRLAKIRECFPDIPIMTLTDLLKFFKNSDSMVSGQTMHS